MNISKILKLLKIRENFQNLQTFEIFFKFLHNIFFEKSKKIIKKNYVASLGSVHDFRWVSSISQKYVCRNLKDMLKVGGENVAALEIESFYNNHEGVMISQVVGVDDERLGEVPALFIETKEGVTLTAEELIESAKGKISNFKIPRYVVFVDDWPMSSTKVQKFKLKDYDLGEKVFG